MTFCRASVGGNNLQLIMKYYITYHNVII